MNNLLQNTNNMTKNLFLNSVRQDVINFLCQQNQLLLNERHFQVELARYQGDKYSHVYTEYLVPLDEITQRKPFGSKDEYPWLDEVSAKHSGSGNSQSGSSDTQLIYIDIVVEKDGEFVLVELKYPTDQVFVNDTDLTPKPTLFGEPFLTNSKLLNRDAAQPHHSYLYWKDVRRMEVIKTRFKHVVGGLAVFLTNDKSYKRGPIRSVKYANFCIKDGRKVNGPTLLDWANNSKMVKSHPNFIIDGNYTCNWGKPISIQGIDFDYLILDV